MSKTAREQKGGEPRSPRGRQAPASRIGKRRVTAKNDSSEYYTGKRAALIEAAANLFKEKGLNAVSLDEVAQRAGTDRSSLYYYVSSKHELFIEVVGDAIAAVTKKAEAIRDSTGTPAEKLENLLIALMVSYAENYPNLYVFLQESFAGLASSEVPGKERLMELNKRFENILKTIIKEGVADGTFRSDIYPSVTAYAALGMANWSHRWFEPEGLLSAEEVGKAFANIILSGVTRR